MRRARRLLRLARSGVGADRAGAIRAAARCDALQTKRVSPLTFGALSGAGARGVAVSEAEVEAAMVFAFRALRIVAEPGGAVALAALISGKVDVPEGSVVVVSGGNVDPELYARIVGR